MGRVNRVIYREIFKRQPYKMVKHAQIIQTLTENKLSVFSHIVGLAFEGLTPNLW